MGCLIEDTKLERDDALDYIDNNGCYDRVPTPYQDYKELVATRTKLKTQRNCQQLRKEPMEVPIKGGTATRRLVPEVLKAHPNARDSTIPVEIKEDGTRVYDTRGIHVGNSFVIDTPRRKTRQELDQARNINYSPCY